MSQKKPPHLYKVLIYVFFLNLLKKQNNCLKIVNRFSLKLNIFCLIVLTNNSKY